MDKREKDIVTLCNKVLYASTMKYYNSNGPDESGCPFCNGRVYYVEYDLKKLPHDRNCAYLIAKDLMTNIK